MTITKIHNLINSNKPLLSFEIFPPKNPKAMGNLKKKLDLYKRFDPDFISVTYGAGGHARRDTIEIADYIQNSLGITVMSHLASIGHSPEELKDLVNQVKEKNIYNIMAIRGDIPEEKQSPDKTVYEAVDKTPDETVDKPNIPIIYGNELIQLIRNMDGGQEISIGCAGYPEGHIESTSKQMDMDNIKRKIDAGANFIVTQFFLQNVFFRRFRDLLIQHGINIPVLAGILPISNFSQITRFSLMCGCTIPAKVMRGLHGKSDQDQELFGLEHAANQVEDLLKEGVDGIHIFALNKKSAVERLAPIVVKYNRK